MSRIEMIFNAYCESVQVAEDFEDFINYEVNENDEVTALELFDSDYDSFPFVTKIGDFVGEFKHLKHLDIEVNDEYFRLNTRPLSDLTALQTISISLLSGVDDLSFVQKMHFLRSISISLTAIHDIQPLADKIHLTSISLPSARVQDITALRHLSNLTTIDFSSNKIENIDALLHCQKLQSINLDYNQIRSINVLQHLHELHTISISNNQLSDLNALRYLNKITSLSAYDNQISNVDFLENLTNINHLNLRNNQITNIDYLKNYTQLSTLDISNNPIQSIDCLQHLTTLTSLYASNLNLTIRDNFELKSILINADFSHCNLRNVAFLANQNRLIELNLSYNQISDIDCFKGFHNLSTFKLRANNIHKVIDIAQFLRLRYFDLRDNPFANAVFKFPSLKLQELVANDFLQKGNREAALAYYYFDKYNTRQHIRSQFDIRLYLLKRLSERDSPFVYHLQLKLLETLNTQPAYTEQERQLKAKRLDIILNIKDRPVEKPTTTERLPYYFANPSGFHDMFLPTMKKLFDEERALLKGVFVPPKPKKRKYYQRKTESKSDTFLITVITILVVAFVGIIAGTIGAQAALPFMLLAKLIMYIISKAD